MHYTTSRFSRRMTSSVSMRMLSGRALSVFDPASLIWQTTIGLASSSASQSSNRKKPRRTRCFLKTARVTGNPGAETKKPPDIAVGRLGLILTERYDYAACALFSRAFLACATMAEKAAASVMARSERILRSASIPAALRPSMKRE
jgi:hypothetical protein